MKKFTSKKAAAVMNKVLNQARRNIKEKLNGYKTYRYFTNAWKEPDGNCYACDGFRIIKLFNGYPDGLAEIWSVHILTSEQMQEMENRHSAAIKSTFETVYPAAKKEIDKPSIDYIRNNMNELNSIQLPGENIPYYNAYWLIDIINLFPDGKWFIIPEKGKISPLYVTDNVNGECIIMPVLVKEQTEKETA